MEAESPDDLREWVDAFDITHLVGGDYDRSVWKAFHVQNSRPQYALVGRDFVVDLVTTDHDEATDRALELLDE